MSWKIVKKGYSRSPWRIVVDGECELYSTCSRTGIQHPVCGQTRAEIEAWLLDRCEWYATRAKMGLVPSLYSANWRTTDAVANSAKVAPTPPDPGHERG